MSTPRLIADIGGTNARFALLDGRVWRDEQVLACADYPDIVSAIEHYLESVSANRAPARPVEGALAIAGPITSDIVRMTNLFGVGSATVPRPAGPTRRVRRPDTGGAVVKVRPGAVIRGAGHMTNLERPEAFNDELRRFCLEIPL